MKKFLGTLIMGTAYYVAFRYFDAPPYMAAGFAMILAYQLFPPSSNGDA